MSSFDEILAAAKPREAVAKILLNQDLLDQHAELDAQLAEAVSSGADVAASTDLARQIGEIEASIEAAKVPFRFVAIGYRRWMDLLRDHPPTKKHTGVDHNPETFPFAAVAASCADPVMTVEQVHQLVEPFSLVQWEGLWHTCLLVNRGGDQAPKSLMAGGLIRHLNGSSVPQPTITGSPAVSSPVE